MLQKMHLHISPDLGRLKIIITCADWMQIGFLHTLLACYVHQDKTQQSMIGPDRFFDFQYAWLASCCERHFHNGWLTYIDYLYVNKLLIQRWLPTSFIYLLDSPFLFFFFFGTSKFNALFTLKSKFITNITERSNWTWSFKMMT